MDPESYPHLRAGAPNGFRLPQRLARLADLAYNLWWTWNSEAERVFRLIDLQDWEAAGHNPVTFLRKTGRRKLDAAARDRTYLELYDQVVRQFDEYMRGGSRAWFARDHHDHRNQPVAYFSTEFGLHESLPIYAGGLGILSGDHLKEASDLGLPMVALGFLYTQGYFKQHIREDGWQEARYTTLSFTDLPVYPVLDLAGSPMTINVDLDDHVIQARLWRIQVGRVPLYLLDSNVETNQPTDRSLTAQLYISDPGLRISQEIVLGLGGVRALRALGYNPAAWHLNEGHSAFMMLERVRELVAAGRSFAQAAEAVRASTIFTTHTPVPAGHDAFPYDLIDRQFSKFWPQIGLDRESFIDLGRQPEAWGQVFSMSALAFHLSGRYNAVSEIHGQVARRMWSPLWPDLEPEQVPLQHITNGVHTGSWLARRMRGLYDRYLDLEWEEHLDQDEIWQAVERIPDEELWGVRRHLKRKLVAFMRERARRQWIPGSLHPVQIVASGVLLDPYALTIGFARRFATYKRANLILRDPDRILNLMNQLGRPLQLVFAGKAHPADEPGKLLIQQVYNLVKRSDNGGRLVFLEDYDMNVARYLIQGVDVWLNTPRRPNEASGTSGQKAALNGVLNLSILDGWWPEGYNGSNGWAIGGMQDLDDTAAQDDADAEALYQLLEEEIIPLYYDERSSDGLPREWLARIKESIRTLAPRFSMRRMVKEYIETMYLPALPETEKVS
ncbi:MAG TPA: alpha-glucan family phosphorylase [Anaerolineales bacterium]|nr:alpha-glucan family phosphorylase [Anaerolineales bacterium]